MMRNLFLISGLLFLLARTAFAATAGTVPAYRLTYEEQEAGTAPYKTQYIVTDRFLRINDLGEPDGFILYDDKTRTIYSVSMFDHRTLVMKNLKYKKIEMDKLVDTSYLPLKDSPKISGHPVYRYRVNVKGQKKNICADIQVAEKLLPQVTKILQRYKQVLAANQVKDLHKTPDEFKTPCFIADQVYDAGAYYSKGLPVLEWHSNNARKTLLNFEKVKVNPELFVTPVGYKNFSLP